MDKSNWEIWLKSNWGIWLSAGVVLAVIITLCVVLIPRPNHVHSYATYSGGSSSSTRKYLSESTQRKIFYDMIATQDQNPYSNEWNQGVKQAAADYYNVPMSQIGEIIRQGATEGWLQPDPP